MRIVKLIVTMADLMLLTALPTRAATLTTLASFVGSGDGSSPTAELISVGRMLYGTTARGGASGQGTVYRIDPSTGVETVVYSFKGGADGGLPQAALIDVGGVLYGTTANGGASSDGTVFSFNLSTRTETVVYSFKGGSDGANPAAALIDVGSTLYGTTPNGGALGHGTVFSLNPATGAENVVHSFKGGRDGSPQAALVATASRLYGTTSYGGYYGRGSVYKVNPATGIKVTVYSFKGGADGSAPLAALINYNGMLYGTTSLDGAGGGTVFSLDPPTGVETVLHSFSSSSDGNSPNTALVNIGGTLYGTTVWGGGGTCEFVGCGTVFAINPSTGAETVVHGFNGADGYFPATALTVFDGALYGTTGSSYFSLGHPEVMNGTVFSVDPSIGAVNTIHDFTGATSESTGLTNVSGKILAVGSSAGRAGVGAILKIDGATGAAKTIYSFTGVAPSTRPNPTLLAVGDMLYGTTSYGGASGAGTVFAVNPSAGTETVAYSFKGGSDGANPTAGLIPVGSLLYGTTPQGGAPGFGTVFSFDPSTGNEVVVHSFQSGSDGASPAGALVDVGGTLYGATTYGGMTARCANCGTVYSLAPATGAERVVHSFNVNDGFPASTLIDVSGMLYGTATVGTVGHGTVFAVNPSTGATTVLYTFLGGSDGAVPAAGLIAFAGKLYGTTQYGGASNFGTVFSVDPATNGETVLYSFTGGPDGGYPESALIVVGNDLYGSTDSGGAMGLGTVFKLAP